VNELIGCGRRPGLGRTHDRLLRHHRRREHRVAANRAEFAMFIGGGIIRRRERRASVVQTQAGREHVLIGGPCERRRRRKTEQNDLQRENIRDDAAHELPSRPPAIEACDPHALLSRGDYHTRR
jgi:hypothetical protein